MISNSIYQDAFNKTEEELLKELAERIKNAQEKKEQLLGKFNKSVEPERRVFVADFYMGNFDGPMKYFLNLAQEHMKKKEWWEAQVALTFVEKVQASAEKLIAEEFGKPEDQPQPK